MHREILYAFIAGFICGFGSLAGIITLGLRRAAKLEAAEPSECPDEVEPSPPGFDMCQCKPGDKLLTKHGNVVTYIGPSGQAEYPHTIEYQPGNIGTRCDDGRVFAYRHLPGDEDIVGFAPKAPPVAVYDKPSAEEIEAARSIVKNNGDCMGEPLRGKCAQCPFFEAECLDWSLATTATFARAWLAERGIPVEEGAAR